MAYEEYGFGLYRIEFKETQDEMNKKLLYEMDRRRYGEPPKEIEPDYVFLYADDPYDAIDKATERYGRPIKEVLLMDTSREQDPKWIEEMFVKGGWKK